MLGAESIATRLQQPLPHFVPNSETTTYREAKRDFEQHYFRQLLEATNYNITRAARRAGLDRSHLRTKLNSLGIFIARAEKDETPAPSPVHHEQETEPSVPA
jgi:DNA-binding NtrC family response regulator